MNVEGGLFPACVCRDKPPCLSVVRERHSFLVPLLCMEG